jgi:hypothetical protein
MVLTNPTNSSVPKLKRKIYNFPDENFAQMYEKPTKSDFANIAYIAKFSLEKISEKIEKFPFYANAVKYADPDEFVGFVKIA